jgi:HD-GYP domain-containing protein (c-di-GMP phosphodiesterase class II)
MLAHLPIWNDYRGLPPALIRYLIAISLTGPVLAIVWTQAPARGRSGPWLDLAILTMMACLAERVPIHLTHKTYINVSTAVFVAMLLAVPLPYCGTAALVASAGAFALRRVARPDLGIAEGLFNTGQTTLFVTVSAVMVDAVGRANLPAVTIGDIAVAELLAASISLHVLNTVLVAGASARHLGISSFRLWRHNALLDLGPHVGMTLIGLCAAQLAVDSPLLIPTLAVPAILVHRAVNASVQLRQNVRHALESLVDIVELRDPYTAGHSRRVAEYSRKIAEAMGLTAEEADAIQAAGHVHDLGKVAIDPAVLLKPGKLDAAEWEEMKRHPVFGADALQQFEQYREGAELIRGHHESWDGAGYPDHLAGTDIALGSRILAVADTFDALTSDRPYRKGMERERAFAILQEGAGSQWDPDVVAAFLAAMDATPVAISVEQPADPRRQPMAQPAA